MLNKLLFQAAVNAAIIGITAALPFLGLPVISTVFSFIVNKIASSIFKNMEETMELRVIDFENKEEKEAYEKSVTELKVAEKAGDADALQKATAELELKLSKLISFKRV